MKFRISYKYLAGQVSTETTVDKQSFNKVQDRKIVHLVLSDPVLVELVTQTLDLNGYDVHSFTDTSIAIHDIEKCRESVSVLITEELMPPGNGYELAKHTRAVAPNIPLVFVSDFKMNPEEFGKVFPKLEGLITFIRSPIDVDKLVSITMQYIQPYSEMKSIAAPRYAKSIDDDLSVTSRIEMSEGLQLELDASA